MPEEYIKALLILSWSLLGILMNEIFTKDYSLVETAPRLDRWMLKRSAALQAMRIEEARTYLDLLITAFQHLPRATRAAPKESRSRQMRLRAWGNILELLDVARAQRFRVDTIDDPVLARLDEGLVQVVSGERDSLLKVIKTASMEVGLTDEQRQRIAEAYERGIALITEMQLRLDHLAHIAP